MRSVLLTTLFLASACASQTRIPEPVRSAISARHAGRVVELRQSMYVGDLYDENELWLLSPHAFDQTSHIVDTKGVPIRPTGQRGIIPAGTAFVVDRVEFPDVAALARRMLTTPRYNTWVYLEPAPGTLAPAGRKAFIVLLPMDLAEEAEVEAAIAKVLSPAGETKRWLESRKPTIRVAIEHKEILAGMSLDEVVASMGEPIRWFVETTGGKRSSIAWYGAKEAWLFGDVVTSVKPGRPVAPEPVQTAAAPAE